jgi:murein DD-endopeptidase MepM/ murein hydrolase activator NlpD
MRRLLLVIIMGLFASGCGAGSSPSASPADTPTDTPASATDSASPSLTPSATPSTTSPTATPKPSPSSAPASARTVALHYFFPVSRCAASPSSSHHDYPASDIFTKKGCRFVAVVAGRVDEVTYVDRWSPSHNGGALRGGRSVSIVGDDGVRYYGSHLLRIAAGIKPGVRVRAGQLLGLIDNSGDARYTPTHVHFGISWPTRHGIWWVRRGMVWPQQYLRAWRNHQNLSPAAAVRRLRARVGTIPRCTAEC